MSSKSALVLLSGGLDSVTTMAWVSQQGYRLTGAVSFIYGQRHAHETSSAAAVAAHYQVPHQTVALAPIEGSHLTNLDGIPQGRDLTALSEDIAPTYVPNRNMILIAYAAARALLMDVSYLIGGVE